MKENKISHRQLLKKDDAIAYLENITKSLKEGRLVIERNGQFVSLHAPEIMSMEFSAKDKKDKSEITIELSWRKEPFVPDIEQLNISSTEPPEPVEEEEIAAKEDKKAAPQKEAGASKTEPEIKKADADKVKADTKTPAKSK